MGRTWILFFWNDGRVTHGNTMGYGEWKTMRGTGVRGETGSDEWGLTRRENRVRVRDSRTCRAFLFSFVCVCVGGEGGGGVSL